MADDGLCPGDLLAGRYRLIDRIGTGGMSVIWRAHDDTLDRLVAVKVLDLALSNDSRMRDLVRREAWAAARLNHPDVAGVHDFVLVGGEIGVLVMQLVEGDPLADLIALGPLPWREAARIGARVARVLELAHSRGVIHRDITPDNVIVNGDRVTVLDFGIAARIGEPDDDSTGASFGTLAYVAPERLDGTAARTATDVYALGVVLFEMLTGRVPFRVSGWDDVAADHGRPPVPRVPGAPARLGRLVTRMLARDPAQRPAAAEVVAVLSRLSPPRRLAAVAGSGLVLAAAATVFWWPELSGVDEAEPPMPVPSAPASSTGGAGSLPTTASPTAALAMLPSRPMASPSRREPTEAEARQTLLALVNQAEAEGAMSQDAALDLRQVIRNAVHVSHVDNVRVKIDDRVREGVLAAAWADRLRPAVRSLADALGRA